MFSKTTAITPKLADEFIEIKFDTTDRFKEITPEDKTNVTTTNRRVEEYNRYLKIDLVEMISRLSRLAGRPVNILDSGSGRCFAVDELLSNPKLKDVLGSCTCVSMNYFTDVEKIMAIHGNRFVYIYGKTQDFLEKTKRKFDLILDLSGAHLYSVDKIYLIQLYFEALLVGGRAEVYHAGVSVKVPDDTEHFYSSISKKYARTFFDRGQSRLTIYKSSETMPFPLPKLIVCKYSEGVTSWPPLPMEQARTGNGVAPDNIEYKFA